MPPCLDLEVVAPGLESALPSAEILENATPAVQSPDSGLFFEGRDELLIYPWGPVGLHRCCEGDRQLLGLPVPGIAGSWPGLVCTPALGWKLTRWANFHGKYTCLCFLAKMGSSGFLAPFGPLPAWVLLTQPCLLMGSPCGSRKHQGPWLGRCPRPFSAHHPPPPAT